MELVETRWKRYGHDRVYVQFEDGTELGHIDIKAQTVVAAAPEHTGTLEACLRRWTEEISEGAAPTPEPEATPSPDPVMPEPIDPPVADPWEDASPIPDPAEEAPEGDLAANRAGEAAWAKRNEVHAEAPILNTVARLFGEKTDERAWRIGAKGEEKVGKILDKLGDGWHVLHAVPVGENGSDIDHLVIGPGGVFTLNTKRHPGANIWVGERVILVNGQSTKYLRNSRFEASRSARLLTEATGRPVDVHPVIVLVSVERLTIKQMPTDVRVLGRFQVLRWLRSQPTRLDPTTVDAIYEAARQRTTWQASRPA